MPFLGNMRKMLLVFGLVGEQVKRTRRWHRNFLLTRCIAAVHRPIMCIVCAQVWVSNCIGCGDESNLTVVAVQSLRAWLGLAYCHLLPILSLPPCLESDIRRIFPCDITDRFTVVHVLHLILSWYLGLAVDHDSGPRYAAFCPDPLDPVDLHPGRVRHFFHGSE